jgi:hypothetical protein
MQEIEKRYRGHSKGRLLLPMGCDFSWKGYQDIWNLLEPVMQYINTNHSDKYKLHYTTLTDYMTTEAASGDFFTTDQEFLPYGKDIN